MTRDGPVHSHSPCVPRHHIPAPVRLHQRPPPRNAKSAPVDVPRSGHRGPFGARITHGQRLTGGTMGRVATSGDDTRDHQRPVHERKYTEQRQAAPKHPDDEARPSPLTFGDAERHLGKPLAGDGARWRRGPPSSSGWRGSAPNVATCVHAVLILTISLFAAFFPAVPCP
jgi:hypothetical protein